MAKLFANGKTLTEVKQEVSESTAPPTGAGGRVGFPSFTEAVYGDLSASQPFEAHDLSGFWQAHGTALPTNQRHEISLNPPPMTPWAQARYDAAKPGLNGTAPAGRSPWGTIRS